MARVPNNFAARHLLSRLTRPKKIHQAHEWQTTKRAREPDNVPARRAGGRSRHRVRAVTFGNDIERPDVSLDDFRLYGYGTGSARFDGSWMLWLSRRKVAVTRLQG
jgi:hypothetical protein